MLELMPVDANLKIRYGVPEIWMADPEEAKIAIAETRLREAGLRCVAVAGADLLAVPTQQLVQSLELTWDSVVLHTDGDEIEISDSEPAVMVSCTPRAAEGAPPNLRSALAAGVQVYDTCAFYDLYLASGVRLAIYGELVDFGVLAEQRTASQNRNMVVLGQLLKKRLTQTKFDDRLLNMQLRRRAGHGVPVNLRESRKGYSYASPGLDTLMAELTPALANISQTELCSRLAYLTSRAGMGALAASM